ncbi:MAG: Coenzyme F420 hydrogenase/dehydrogenase, beta subunit C-terminal domain, partial [Dysgonamonadaceae bacterium]|nr:Coenzyme F420 hydrogenase/dehydrogenase, beta subunit C-terminal domain [Dysgonamonadaceae bacterium]
MNNIAKSGVNPCCGCGICVVSCPHNAIVFSHNNEGFLKPTVDNVKCTDCGICTKVCYKYLEEKKPFANTFENKPVYAAWSKNRATVLSSSSGGVGFELTSYYFEQGYNICGCIFDAPNDCCKHIIVRSEDGLEAIKTSKYLQSNTVGAFSQFKKSEKQVVIGTPCQIYGLRKWIQLKKWEENFILVDFFCHGTPSFNLWKKYKEYISKNYNLNSKFESVNFRKKNPESKWHKNAISIRDFSGKQFEKGRAFAEDLFFKFFLNNSCLSESCYNCVLRLDHCAADIRIADFWGSKYAGNDDGVSLVITNTE